MDQTIDHGRVAALTPGRVRIRLHRPHRHLVHAVKAHLEAQTAIGEVATNAVTGSVLVQYNRHAVSCNDVLAMCRDVGVVVSSIVEAEAEPVPPVEEGGTAETIIGALSDLDRRVSRVTGRTVDLRLLAPLAVGAFGVRQLVVAGLGNVSGYILLWIAVDSFLRLRHQGRNAKRRASLRAGVLSSV